MADLVITPAQVLKGSGSQVQHAFAAVGVTITAGQAIYVDTTTSLASLSDANGTTPLNACTGISLNGASPGQPVAYVAADLLFTIGTGLLTSGQVLYVSGTPGGISASYSDVPSGGTVICLGVANGTATFNLNITTGGTK